MDSTSQESGNIKAIDRSSVHRICSGQVVLTLATAVKELVENSIDAGATNIEVKLKEYGSELIEVLDNGSGVKSCDYQSLTLKHHTSKIGDFSDLPGVNTFGFRGEALSSLCALSKLSITTCHRDSDVGDRLEYNHDGLILKQTPMARKVGTTVLVENLFSTLPVRHKEFCKNLKKEFGKMVQLLTAYCLISTQKRITCVNNTAKGKKTFILSTNGDATIRGNISCIYGPKQVSNLMEFVQKAPSDSILEEFNIVAVPKEDSYRIEGFLSPSTHGEGRSTSDRQFFFINGRPCDIPKVAKVINDVYHSFNRHQFPFVCLNIELLKDNVDVNVTPDKRQIFISSEKTLLATIKTSILAMYEHQPSTLKLHTLNFPKMNHVVGQSLSNSCDGDNFQDNASMSSKLKRSCDDSSDVGTASPIPFKSPRLSGDMDCDGHIEQQFPSPCENDMGNHLNSNDTIGDRISSTGEGQNKVMANTSIIALTQLKNGKTHPINFAVTLPFKEDNGLNKSIKKGSVFRQSSVLKCVTQFSRESHKSYSFGVNSPSISKKTPDSLPKILRKKQTLFPTPKKPDINLIIQHHEQQLRHCQFNIHQNEPVPNTSETQEMELSGNDITIDATNNDDPIFIDEVRKRKRKYVQLDFQLDVIKDRLKSEITHGARQSSESYRKFRSKFNAKDAELELSKEISKDMFSKMEIVGQFNLGFIIAKFQEDLFIIDQHATDEKYNFEVLQKETVLETQRLLNPQTLELTADSETVLLDNCPIFEKNGFKFIVSEGNTPGQRVQLVSTPVSQNWSFGKEDVDELIFMLSDNSGKMCRPSRVRQMFASRACRKSVMIGSPLSRQTMKKLVCHMGEIEQPWNCPHGRPTMRHLFNLNFLQ